MNHYFKTTLSSLLLLSLCATASLAQDVHIVLPKVPEVPKVEAIVPKVTTTSPDAKTNAQIIEEVMYKKEVVFSNHVAPKTDVISNDSTKVTKVGDISKNRVTAYLQAPLLAVSEVSSKLEEAGFSVIKTFKVDKKGIATSIIFTNADIIKAASKKNRGFAASLRVTIDKKSKLISIENPLFTFQAFMQDEYDEALANKTLDAIRTAFTNLENSDEVLKVRVLKRYQFMAGMPKYEDMQVIKKAPTATLLERARKSKKIVFEQKLLNGSTLIGVKLSKRTSKFIKKTGYKNAGLLPYPVLIENGEAKILDPKYYIAIMYPKLKMSQFMTIATVPGAISKDVDKIFR